MAAVQAAVAAQAVAEAQWALPSAAPGGATESEDAGAGGVGDGACAAAGRGVVVRRGQEGSRGRGRRRLSQLDGDCISFMSTFTVVHVRQCHS